MAAADSSLFWSVARGGVTRRRSLAVRSVTNGGRCVRRFEAKYRFLLRAKTPPHSSGA